MPVIVPILRLCLLSLNVYDTFKILKLPQRSARTGKRTVQAMSQRKRNMKGCMCVWVVWCTSIFLERILDNAIGLFMPFYNELKAVVFLFQLVTRTKGAEPIYIHVLRPLIKPYVATLDYSLELCNGLGDFMLLVLLLPYHIFSDWGQPKQINPVHSESSELFEVEAAALATPPDAPEFAADANANMVGVRTRRSLPQSNAIAGPSTARANNGISSRPDPSAKRSVYEVWYPPDLIRNEDSTTQVRRVVSDSASTPAAVQFQSYQSKTGSPKREELDLLPVHDEQEDWRAYPPFPSAYPPTPFSLGKRLPEKPEPVNLEAVGEQNEAVVAEMEEWRRYEPFPSAYPHTPEVKNRSVPVLPSAARMSSLDPVAEKDADSDRVPINSGPLVDEYGMFLDERSKVGASARPKATSSQSLPTRTGVRTRGDRADPATRHPLALQPGQQHLQQQSLRPRKDGREQQDFRRVARVAA